MSSFFKPVGSMVAIAVLAALSIGCQSSGRATHAQRPAATPALPGALLGTPTSVSASVLPADHQAVPGDHPLPAVEEASATTNADPFAGKPQLDLRELTAAVLERNPSIRAMIAAWQAAAERYPQVISLDDPMLAWALGPGSFGTDAVNFAWMIEGSQKIPWPGKLHLRGHSAQAEADAANQDITTTRLELAEMTAQAYLDLFLARRFLELNAKNIEQVTLFRTVADAHYRTGKTPGQQDVLQAEVVLADLGRRQVELERMDRIAIARINTLLHRAPDHALPAPPDSIEQVDLPPSGEELRRLALERRPDLAAEGARIRAEEAALELACKEFYPDFEVMARYDAFWQEKELRPVIGLNLNLPIRQDRRHAAVREAAARLAQRRAEYDRRADQIQLEVESAFQRLVESRKAIDFYTRDIIPKATLNVESTRAGYEAPNVDFLRLIEAQRQLIEYREKHYEAMAEHHRRRAELERVIGGPIP